MSTDPEELARVYARIEVARRTSLNPLHDFVLVAGEFARWYRRHLAPRSAADAAQADGWGAPLSERSGRELPPARSAEEAGILGVYHWLARRGDTQYLFGNDLSRVIHGIDALASLPRGDGLLICEAKGTARPIAGGFRSYLTRTKTLGRQLSWRWCWNRLILLACHANTAEVFLRALRPFVEARAKRVLIVTRAERVGDGFVPTGEGRDWSEPEFAEDAEMSDPHNREAQARWLREIDAAGAYPSLD